MAFSHRVTGLFYPLHCVPLTISAQKFSCLIQEENLILLSRATRDGVSLLLTFSGGFFLPLPDFASLLCVAFFALS